MGRPGVWAVKKNETRQSWEGRREAYAKGFSCSLGGWTLFWRKWRHCWNIYELKQNLVVFLPPPNLPLLFHSPVHLTPPPDSSALPSQNPGWYSSDILLPFLCFQLVTMSDSFYGINVSNNFPYFTLPLFKISQSLIWNISSHVSLDLKFQIPWSFPAPVFSTSNPFL